MGILKKILFTIALIIIVLIGIGFLLPSEYKVERSIQIDAPASEVYAEVIELKRWQAWGTWFERDPNMQLAYSGPNSGIGAKSEWKSETEGNGEMVITNAVPYSEIIYDLTIVDFGVTSTGKFIFAEQNGKTTVTWMDYGDVGSNPVNRYFGMLMDSMIGPSFEQGLKNLKKVVEK